MPQRLVDGEAIWSSQKIKSIPQEWIRGEYANLLPLALANGVFELDLDAIWNRVYGYLRPHITRENVREIFDAFEAHGLIFRFEKEGKIWGYFVGIEKAGRLPPKSEKKRYRNGPAVPQKELSGYLLAYQEHIGQVASQSRLYRESIGKGLDRDRVWFGLDREKAFEVDTLTPSSLVSNTREKSETPIVSEKQKEENSYPVLRPRSEPDLGPLHLRIKDKK